MQFRLQALRDTYVPALQRKADSLDADSTHDTQRLEELQADYALLEHELQVKLTPALLAMHTAQHYAVLVVLAANVMVLQQQKWAPHKLLTA